ncbi:MAG: HAD-IB family hydrolase [Frankiaceae bacterium]|jgi:HAD superfamily hydrolase (TIGR01490 family)|nr:HAD-IB family hydrolase [Frankiaceae bacterium]
MGSPAAFFDLDKTVIARSSVLAFGRPFRNGGLLTRRSMLRGAYVQLLFALSGADQDQVQRMRDHITSMCTGWDSAQVREIVRETLHDIIDPLVYDEAVALIDEHRARGEDVILVSASGEEVVEPIGEMLGAQHVIATRMVAVDGVYTGEIDFYAYGPNKAAAITELARQRGYDLSASYAYSDSSTDLAMLDLVGRPTAVNPDRALRRVAAERGWPILEFSLAVPLHQRLRPAPITAGAIGAIAAGAAAAALAVQRRRRRRSRAPGPRALLPTVEKQRRVNCTRLYVVISGTSGGRRSTSSSVAAENVRPTAKKVRQNCCAAHCDVVR